MGITHRNLVDAIAMCNSQQKRTAAINHEITHGNHEPWNVRIVKKTNEKALYNSLERLSSL